MDQYIIEGRRSYEQLGRLLVELNSKKYLLVYTGSVKKQPVWDYLNTLEIPHAEFCEFTPNPKYEECEKGVDLFNAEGCDTILAIGGGSAIDVAKCIKLYCKMPKTELYLKQPYTDTGIPLIAMPTTAGTGSESTPFSVIYYQGEKQSVHHESILPDYAVLSGDVLESLPIYQKKCTMLDALCQGIESWWSVHSNEASRENAENAVRKIMKHMDAYLDEHSKDEDRAVEARNAIMSASNYAGCAIGITSTTAPHAMCYKITTTYNLPHGHAVALCLPYVWRYMLSHPEKVTDRRGADYLFGMFTEIAHALGCETAEEAVEKFEKMLVKLGIGYPTDRDPEARARSFADAVNVERLGNNPVALDNAALYTMYKGMLTK